MANYGTWAKGSCKPDGVRTYSAQLLNITGSWEDACARQPVSVSGVNKPKADRCLNVGTGMFGEVDVPDQSCAPKWGEWSKGNCNANETRTYSSQLGNITGSWEDACAKQPVSVAGVNKPKADRCLNVGTGMFGEVDVPDQTCSPKWGEWSKGNCNANGTRTYSSQLGNITGSWENACAKKSVSVAGVNKPKADRCVNTGTMMLGEVDVPDQSCVPKWAEWSKGNCTPTGSRTYSSQLLNITGSWEDACAKQSVSVAGVNKPKADRCLNTGSGLFGEVDVPDQTCVPKWADWSKGNCTTSGNRTYSSQLLNITGSWEEACAKQPVSVAGVNKSKADRCLNTGTAMFGEVDVPDQTCSTTKPTPPVVPPPKPAPPAPATPPTVPTVPNNPDAPKWSEWSKGECTGAGLRIYSSQLLNIVGGWEDACAKQPVSIDGVNKPKPDRCINKGASGMFGEADLQDQTCMPTWTEWRKDDCSGNGLRKYSSQCKADKWEACDNPDLLNWPSTVDGKTVVKSNGPIKVGDARWGEVDVKDDTCSARWTDWTKGDCNTSGSRTYSAKLTNIVGDWTNVCNSQPVSVAGTNKPKPDRCFDKGVIGQWGEVDVPDPVCMPTWGGWRKDNCLSKTTRKYSAQCHADKWETCDKMGTVLKFPETVENKKVIASVGPILVGQARWGEVTVKDDNCADTGIFGGEGVTGNIGWILVLVAVIVLLLLSGSAGLFFVLR